MKTELKEIHYILEVLTCQSLSVEQNQSGRLPNVPLKAGMRIEG